MKLLTLILFFILGSLSLYSQCDNVGFENGNLNGWICSTGYVTTDTVAFNNTGIENGVHTLTNGSGYDEQGEPCGILLTKVAPGSRFSVKLGNSFVESHAEKMVKTFVVDEYNNFFLYRFAVVLQDPDHEYSDQPRFEVRVKDKDGNILPCGLFTYRAGGNIPGFQTCGDVRIKDWSRAAINLEPYVGQEVTIEFLTSHTHSKSMKTIWLKTHHFLILIRCVPRNVAVGSH